MSQEDVIQALTNRIDRLEREIPGLINTGIVNALADQEYKKQRDRQETLTQWLSPAPWQPR